MIELENANFDAYDPSYYQNAGNLMYFFGDDTKLITSFLEYPSEIQQFGNSLSPLNYLVSSRYKDSFLFSFPHGQVIHRLSSSLNFVSDEKYLLPLSKYFNYKIEGADQIVSMSGMMDGGDMPNIPLNHNFLTIVESDENIFIQTWMSDPEDLPQDREFYTHLLIYNKSEEVWYEMLQPRRFFDLGLLAGVAQDTLFFYEGNLRTTDEKYIKRAVLRPVEE